MERPVRACVLNIQIEGNKPSDISRELERVYELFIKRKLDPVGYDLTIDTTTTYNVSVSSMPTADDYALRMAKYNEWLDDLQRELNQ